ncbi:MAG: PBP1A family penicillin-binding protein [Acidobacteriota bacterium]
MHVPKLPGLVRYFGIAALLLAAALFGTASGVVFAFVGDLPQISALGDFATERRVLVTYDQIPEVLRNAIVAAEDATFFSHGGLRVGRILITLAQDVIHQRSWGGSTLTQQLARKLFLTDDKTPERKIKEALLTIQIEKRYTKQEIFTMYCNKMYWGHYVYGVEAASQLYFAKSVKDLTLDEAAMIAGIIQGNVRQSPYVNMRAATIRRNYTLERMAEEGFITQPQLDAAKARPIVTRGAPSQPPSIAPYFLETVRAHLEDEYGAKAVYEDGLTVRTGIDPSLQRAANRALDAGLRRIDKQRGFRKPTRNLVSEKRVLETYRLSRWERDPAEGDIVPAIVMATEGSEIRVRVGRLTGAIGRAGYEWTKRRTPQELVRRGDVVDVRVTKVDKSAATLTADLDQAPVLQGAVLAIENRTGQILAMVGGQSFERSQFNRATQAQRQVGSLFKPIVFTAAIDRGYTATTILDDSPASYDPGPNQPTYSPKNFDHKYEGPVSLRWALEDSRNVPTVALMSTLGPRNVIAYARQLGITSPIPEYLSTAIGSAEGNLLEMTSAYSAFPDQGVRMTPMLLESVTDRSGNLLEQHLPEPHEALKADTAYILTNLMRGVVLHGTAMGGTAGLRKDSGDWPLAGKTGTTDDLTDAWFIGFDPDITVGVWVGFDQKRTISSTAQGASVALPIWVDVMRDWIDRRKKDRPERPEFAKPENVIVVMLDHGPEAFITGTEPGAK